MLRLNAYGKSAPLRAAEAPAATAGPGIVLPSHQPGSAQPLIRWNARFNTGHPQIDAQHRELVDLLNSFAADVEDVGHGPQEVFDRFKSRLREHFVYEETALRSMGMPPDLLAAHTNHHDESMQLLAGLGDQLAHDPHEHASAVLAEIAHCLLVDLLDEDRYYFVAASTRADLATAPPIAPALSAFGRLFDLLNEHHERIIQARDYYLTLLDDFPTPICRADDHGRFDWFNRTWLSFAGRRSNEMHGEAWFSGIHPEDHDGFVATWTRSFAARTPFTAEYRLADVAGNWCWVHHIGHPFFDSQNGFLGYICTLFDITDRKRAESSLRVSAVVFEHATEAIMITNAAGTIEAVNPAFTRITGYLPGEAIGRSSNLLRSGVHADSFYADMWRAVSTDDRWEGEVVNRRKSGEIFPAWLSISTIRGDKGEIVRMVGVISDIASLRASQEHLTHLAHHDALTGLPNRLLFGARAQHSLERCAREGSRLAILFIDLDRFKPVNDRFGHKVGDRALCEVSARLRSILRGEDTIARFGGDEFVVLVERAESFDDAYRVVEKLLDAFPLDVSKDDETLSVSASIGISLYPDDGTTVDALIDAADQAMYRKKNNRQRGEGT